MKLFHRLACGLLVASAAAQAQSIPEAPLKSASGVKGVDVSGEYASASAGFGGQIKGGVLEGKFNTGKHFISDASANAWADVTVFGKRLRVVGLDARANSDRVGPEGNAVASQSASIGLTVCNYALSRSAQREVVLLQQKKELIIFKASATFVFFFVPVTVSGEFGGGMEWGLTARASGLLDAVQGAPMGVGLDGYAAAYALLRVKVEISAGLGGVGVAGEGQLLRTQLNIGLGATTNDAWGSLTLTVTPLRIRVYVYAWIDPPGFAKQEKRKYLADTSIGGATFVLISLSRTYLPPPPLGKALS